MVKNTKTLVITSISVFLIIYVVINFILMILKRIDPVFFWITTAIVALLAYKGIPYLRSK